MPGCTKCWAKADGKVAQGELTFVERVISESHFGVVLRRCEACKQDYARVLCSMSYYGDRDDSGTHSIPISPAEVEQLRVAVPKGESSVEGFLRTLSPREYSVETGGPVWLVAGLVKILPHE